MHNFPQEFVDQLQQDLGNESKFFAPDGCGSRKSAEFSSLGCVKFGDVISPKASILQVEKRTTST